MLAVPSQIPEGFPGQRMIVLPRPIIRAALAEQLPVAMLPSDIGYFPDAASHYFERPAGCGQLILILCVRGAGWVALKEAQYEVAPGQLVVLLPNQPHRYGAAEAHPWTIYWCHAAGQAAERLGRLLRSESSSPVLEIGDYTGLVRLFEEITDELAKGYAPDHLVPASMALGHLLGLAMANRKRHQVPSDAVLRVRAVIHYMRQRQHERINLPEVARMVNLSLSHFCAVFKKMTGFPPLEYFTRIKIQQACELLDVTDLPIKRVAERSGFTDALYFSRVFTKIYGMPPTAYRNTRKG